MMIAVGGYTSPIFVKAPSNPVGLKAAFPFGNGKTVVKKTKRKKYSEIQMVSDGQTVISIRKLGNK